MQKHILVAPGKKINKSSFRQRHTSSSFRGRYGSCEELAVAFIGKKGVESKKKFWIENISHKTEALRSLVRELVNRFHNNVEPLRQALIPTKTLRGQR